MFPKPEKHWLKRNLLKKKEIIFLILSHKKEIAHFEYKIDIEINNKLLRFSEVGLYGSNF